MFKNPITKALAAGQLFVNLPSLVIGLATPFAVRQASTWINTSVSQETIVFSIVFGMIASWLWWSFTITYWRIWAFQSVEGQQLVTLKRRAIQCLLIHSSQYKSFAQTEVRDRVQREIIAAIENNIWVEEQMHLLFTDVNATPDIAYGVDRRSLLKVILVRLLMAGVGATFLVFSPLPFIGMIIIAVVCLHGNIHTSANHFRQRTPLMHINDRGVAFHHPQPQFFYWDQIQSIQIDRQHRRMTIYLHHKNAPIQRDLHMIAIKDYALLQKRVRFYLKQEMGEWQ